MCRRQELVAILGLDDPIDQFIDGPILDADNVAAAVLAGGIGAQKSRCSFPGNSDCGKLATIISKSKVF